MGEKNILILVAFQELYERCREIVERCGYPVRVELEEPSYPPDIESRWLEEGIEAIIGRGGTYWWIQQACPRISAVEIRVDAFDILAELRRVWPAEKNIAFIGHSNIIFGIEMLGEIFRGNFLKIDIEDTELALEKVKQAARMGIREFISDSDGALVVAQAGYSAHIVQSGEVAIQNSIREAMEIVRARRQEQARAEQIRILMDFIQTGVISMDSSGKITLFNREARQICRELSLDREELLRLIGLPDFREKDQILINAVKKVGEKQAIAVSASAIVVNGQSFGAVATFQNTSQIQQAEQEIRTKLTAKGLAARYTFHDIVYKSAVMEQAIAKAQKYAASNANVLILGETGTGKELFAQSIHNGSQRAKGPFVAVNCAALPENLLESELFGYAEGAFTGARKGGKAGLFELAHRGTILLDEIGDMPLTLQVKLLRVIQEKVVMRIGGDAVIPVDTRIIATTNVDLRQCVSQGKFRADLYYRLNILALTIPALNERREDIPLLAASFLAQYARENGTEQPGMTPEAMALLLRHDFEGNIRELRGIIERAAVLCEGARIAPGDLGLDGEISEGDSLRESELRRIEQALSACGNNYTQAAKLLGIHRSTLYRKQKKKDAQEQ